MSEHTETPWRVEYRDGYITGHITSPHKNWAGNDAPNQRKDSINDPGALTAADAAFIVRAVNNVDRVEGALRKMLEDCPPSDDCPALWNNLEAREEARQALAALNDGADDG